MTYLIGQPVPLEVDVTDADDVATDPASITLVVTLPDATTNSPSVAQAATGNYEAEYVPIMAGRHTAVWTTTTPSGKYAEAFEVVAVTDGAPVTLDDVTDYIGTTSVSDEEISNALAAEMVAQAASCKIPAAYPAPLSEALKRRVARNLALRGIPLAVLQGDADGGSVIMPGRDPEIRRLEAPYRRLKVG